MVGGVHRFGLEASERWRNVGSIRRVAVAGVFSDGLLIRPKSGGQFPRMTSQRGITVVAADGSTRVKPRPTAACLWGRRFSISGRLALFGSTHSADRLRRSSDAVSWDRGHAQQQVEVAQLERQWHPSVVCIMAVSAEMTGPPATTSSWRHLRQPPQNLPQGLATPAPVGDRLLATAYLGSALEF
jgi:hypothetical protein